MSSLSPSVPAGLRAQVLTGWFYPMHPWVAVYVESLRAAPFRYLLGWYFLAPCFLLMAGLVAAMAGIIEEELLKTTFLSDLGGGLIRASLSLIPVGGTALKVFLMAPYMLAGFYLVGSVERAREKEQNNNQPNQP